MIFSTWIMFDKGREYLVSLAKKRKSSFYLKYVQNSSLLQSEKKISVGTR